MKTLAALVAAIRAELQRLWPYIVGAWMQALRQQSAQDRVNAEITKESHERYAKYRAMPDDELDAEWLRRGKELEARQSSGRARWWDVF